MKPRIEPVLLGSDGSAETVQALRRAHEVFNEQFLQDLIADHPDLLPVGRLRADVGDLMSIGREVPTRGSGIIDNLFVSTGGYVVVAETKLWRNPQARREVVAQILDYVKDIVTREHEWFESVWRGYCNQRGIAPSTLIDALSDVDEEVDEQIWFDRFHRGLERGDVLGLIVGDGIEARLQQLVDHLCRDSVHLRYSLGLVALHCYQFDRDERLLALPELVQQVEPIERAHVRVEIGEGLKDSVTVSSAVEAEPGPNTGSQKKTLSSDAFYEGLTDSLGRERAERVRSFMHICVDDGLVVQHTKRGIRLKLPDPLEEGPELPVLAVNQDGTVYNPRGLRTALVAKWGLSEQCSQELVTRYWRELNEIDCRFALEGITLKQTGRFISLIEIVDRLDDIQRAVSAVAASIREARGAE